MKKKTAKELTGDLESVRRFRTAFDSFRETQKTGDSGLGMRYWFRDESFSQDEAAERRRRANEAAGRAARATRVVRSSSGHHL